MRKYQIRDQETKASFYGAETLAEARAIVDELIAINIKEGVSSSKYGIYNGKTGKIIIIK
jgi:hypothetical protein